MELVPQDKKEQLVSYWLEGSIEALETACEILENTRRPLMVLFNLHLALEKLLKSKIVERTGAYAPYSHNLVHLISRVETEISDEKLQQLARFSEYNLNTRYPDFKTAFEKSVTIALAESEVKVAKELLDWIGKL